MSSGDRRQVTKLTDELFIGGVLGADGTHVVASRGVFHRDAYAIKQFTTSSAR